MGVMEAVDVVAVDTVMEVLAEVTTSQEEETGETEEEEEDIRETGTSQPPMAGPGTNFHSAIHMFTQKTADFYRLFLDRLYEVADLLIERPSPEPPDPIQALLRVRPAPLEGLLGRKLAWTRKWTFQLFVKKRRRKPNCHPHWATFFPRLAMYACSSNPLCRPRCSWSQPSACAGS